MIQLKLKSASIASIYGTPQADCDYGETVAALVTAGWKPKEAEYHLECATRAGAYEIVDYPPPKILRGEYKEKHA